MPTFTQSDRITISKRQIVIPLENDVHDYSITHLTAEETRYQDIDTVNNIFYNEHNTNSNSYFDESEYGVGLQYTKITQQDIDDSVNLVPGNIFFPITPTVYTYFNPKVDPKVNGLSTTVLPGEPGHLSNTTVGSEGLNQYIDWMRNGISSGTGTDTLKIAYAGGPIMEVTLGLPNVGTYISIEDIGLFYVTAKGTIGGGPNLGTELTVTTIIAGTAPMGANVQSNIPGYSDSARENPTTPSLLGVYSSTINGKILSWQTKLNNQLAALNANTDNRTPQTAEIIAAKADINNALSVISTWLLAPISGPLSQFTDSQILLISAESTARLAYLPIRASEIPIALGNVTQALDGSVSGNGVFKLRYDALNLRINRISGSLSNKNRLTTAKIGPTELKNGNLAAQAQYDQYFRTEALTASANNTNIVTVASTTGFSIADTIYIMADTLTELTGTITNISGMNITVSFIVPNTYTTINKARIYKLI